jgi:hypothetical protein
MFGKEIVIFAVTFGNKLFKKNILKGQHTATKHLLFPNRKKNCEQILHRLLGNMFLICLQAAKIDLFVNQYANLRS